MARITPINQPFAGLENRLGDHLVSLLGRTADRFDSLSIAVAFAKVSGVNLLFDGLQDFVAAGRSVRIAVGIDHRGTSRQGLELLLRSGAAVSVFHNPGWHTFHPKLYLFSRDAEEAVALVGSTNLTRGGLYENFEFSVRMDFDLNDVEDAKTFVSLVDAFEEIVDPSGPVLPLTDGLLQELFDRGCLADEAQPAPAPPVPGAPGLPPLFRRVPIPRGPRSTLRVVLPVAPPQPGQIVASFAMLLGRRDARQARGYSRDIFIPLAARNANEGFWAWPGAYGPPAIGPEGNYLERWVDLRVTTIAGTTQIVQRVRIYFYAERSEFRLNCGELVQGAGEGDILVISGVAAGSGYDYDAAIISGTHAMHGAFDAVCVNQVTNSSKRWGYT